MVTVLAGDRHYLSYDQDQETSYDQDQETWMNPGLIWYVSYGSNMHAARFACYLQGGRPPGAARDYPGARDSAPSRAAKATWLPGVVYFAMRSQVWDGGRALYDPDLPGKTAGRAYLITTGQFSDVAAQEMGHAPGQDLDLAEVLSTGRHKIGDGHYETLLRIGYDAGTAMVTFTAPWTMSQVELTSPSPAYLRMLGLGLRESHGWDVATTADYLAALPGAHGAWPPADIATLLTGRGQEACNRR